MMLPGHVSSLLGTSGGSYIYYWYIHNSKLQHTCYIDIVTLASFFSFPMTPNMVFTFSHWLSFSAVAHQDSKIPFPVSTQTIFSIDLITIFVWMAISNISYIEADFDTESYLNHLVETAHSAPFPVISHTTFKSIGYLYSLLFAL